MLSIAWSGDARAAEPLYDINVPATNAADALNRFAEQTGAILLFPYDLARTRQANAVRGRYTLLEGLQRLLEGTGLSGGLSDKRVVSISQNESVRRPGEEGDMVKKKVRIGSRIAAFFASILSVSAARGQSVDAQVPTLAEVTVTAQKRIENIRDVPVPVSAINAATLSENNQVRLTDYYTQVPGLIVSPADYSSQLVAIRGITTGSNSGAGTPTTGIMVDDIPFGNSTGNTPGFTVPDFDPGDLARVEVLRGPQGTLYGASSMGGLIKYVTVDPSTAGFAGRGEVSTNSVRNGDELGYTLRGSVNVPVSETFAVRASAFHRQDPGYIDNPVLGIDGVNKANADGAHLAGLWQPTDVLSLKLSAYYQHIKGDGTDDLTSTENVTGQSLALNDLQQGYIAGVGPYDRKAQAYGAVVAYKINEAELTSVTGYNISDVRDSLDYTQYYGGAGGASQEFGVAGAPIYEHVVNSRFSQELRLTIPLGARFDGLVGLYYDDESADPQKQSLLAADARTGAVAGELFVTSFPSRYKEYSAFADLTYHVTDRLDVQVGGRESHMKIIIKDNELSGFFIGPDPVVVPGTETRNRAFTYLLTPRFKLSANKMLYARFASGYRPGGVNTAPDSPATYDPDKTQNYELGFKGDFLERTLSIDTSLYYIDWQNVQLSLATAGGFGFTGNAGKAKSQGVEVSVEWQPISDLSIGSWVAYNDAKLSSWPAEAQAACLIQQGPCASSGARLPLSPRFSANVSIERRFPIRDQVRGFASGSMSYVGGRVGMFTKGPPFPPPRQSMPAYAKTDLRVGLDYRAWRANLYLNNAFDKRGLVSGGLGTDLPYSFYYIQPRSIGISIAREF